MEVASDTEAMEFVILAFLLVIGPLALRYGVDSTGNDTRNRRGSWRVY